MSSDFGLIPIPSDEIPVDRLIDAVLAAVADLEERGLADAIPTDEVPPEVEAALRAALGLPVEPHVSTEGVA